MLLTSRLTLRPRSPLASFLAVLPPLVFAILVGAARLDALYADAAAAMKTVRGRVIDATGAPVGDARLWLPLRYEPRRVAEATADASGHFELTFLADWVSPRMVGSEWTIWAYAAGHGLATQSAFKEVRENSAQEIEIQLPSTAGTSFKVLTPSGEPLADALVQPLNYKTQMGYSLVPDEMLAVVSARTDAGGVARLAAVPPEPLFRLQILSEKFGKQAIRVDRDAQEALREIRLRDTGTIEGRLVGERPEWLRGVHLAFTTENRDEWSDTQGEAKVMTDDNGRFEVPIIASGGPVRIYVNLDPALPVRPRLKDNLFVEAGQTLHLEIPLVHAPKVHGKVLAKGSGKPIVGAEISLGYGGYRQSDRAVTDAEGNFEGRALPGAVRMQIIFLPGDYTQLGEPWAEPRQVPADVAEFELPTIEVAPTRKISGKLIDAKYQPVPATRIIAINGNRRYGFAMTDAEGRFTMSVPEGVETEFEVHSSERGPEPVEIVTHGPLVLRYLPAAHEQTDDAERASKPDVTLTGRVLSGGKPLAGVKLSLSLGIMTERRVSSGGKSPARRMTGMRLRQSTSAVTDADGHFRLSGLKAGDSYQIAVKPPFAATDPAWRHQMPWMPKLPDNAKDEFALPDMNLRKLTQSLAGKVVDPDGKPVAGASVSAMLRNGFQSLSRASTSSPPPWTETDEDGRFQLQQLPDKPLTLMAYIKTKGGGRIRFPAKVNVELNQQDIRIVLDPSLVEEEE